MGRPSLRSISALLAKALVSAGLIAFALRGIDTTTVFDHLKAVDGGTVLAATLVTTAIALLHARRWEIVLARMEHAIPFRKALELVLIGYFFNQTLPSTIGGDAYRAWGAYKRGIHAGNAVASVIVDRVFALLALALMIVAGAWWLFEIVPHPAARWAVLALFIGAAGGLGTCLILPGFETRLQRWRATRMILHVSGGVQAVASTSAVIEVLLLTAAGYALLSYVVYLLAQGMGVDLPLRHALLFVPLVTLISVVPISIAGWGVRESAMVASLGLIGVPSVEAFSLSVLYGLVIMGSGIPGGLLWLLSRGRRAPARASSEKAGSAP
jgi:hypothetical protein